MIAVFSSSIKSQCTFGNFPPTYTFNPGWTNGIWLAQKYTLASTATLTGLGLNAVANSGAPYRMAIYTDASNAPGNFITATGQGTMAQGQNVLSVATVTILPAGDYWISAIFNMSSVPVGSSNSTVAAVWVQGSLSTPPANMASWPNSSYYKLDYWAAINTPSIAVAGPTSVCLGSSMTLTVSGASTYTWNTNANTTTISLTPSVNTAYYVNATGVNGCTASIANTATVYALPDVSITGDHTVCAGSAISLTVLGASSYTWNNGIGTSTFAAIPTTNTTYTVIGMDITGCSNFTTHSVTLISPTLTVAGNTVLCAGNVANLTVSGAINYLWDNGATTSTSSISPSVSTIYTVTGFDANNCMNTKTVSIVVNPVPVIAYATSNMLLCEGETATITVSGAHSFVWNTGDIGATFSIQPSATTVYTVTGTDLNGCVTKISITQSVSACTAIQKTNNGKANVVAFPNPGKGVFEIRVNGFSEAVDYTVMNINGQMVKLGKLTSEVNPLDLSDLANGFYYLQVKSKNDSVTFKLIKE